MVTKEIRRYRCDDALQILMEHNEAVFFTLTTCDEVDFLEIRKRWRSFRNDLMRHLRRTFPTRHIHYVMNYEMHPGYLQKLVKDKYGEKLLHGTGRSHGWHIHGVFSCFVPVSVFMHYLYRHGFGRFDIRRVKSKGVSDYLTKHALKAYQGLSAKEREKYQGSRRRLVNTSRGLPALNDYAYMSAHLDAVRKIMKEEKERIDELKKLVDSDLTIDPFDERASKIYHDYRIARQRAEVCALLGLSHTFELVKVIEWLQAAPLPDVFGYLARRNFESLTKAHEVTSGADGVQISERKRTVRDFEFEERRLKGRKFAAVRRREAFMVK